MACNCLSKCLNPEGSFTMNPTMDAISMVNTNKAFAQLFSLNPISCGYVFPSKNNIISVIVKVKMGYGYSFALAKVLYQNRTVLKLFIGDISINRCPGFCPAAIQQTIISKAFFQHSLLLQLFEMADTKGATKQVRLILYFCGKCLVLK